MPHCGLPLVILAAACSSEFPITTTVSGGQFERIVDIWPGVPEVDVLIVDDGAAATSLREALGTSFAAIERERSSGCWPLPDPAAFEPVQRSVVLVRPSSPDHRYLTSSDNSELSWTSNHRQEGPELDRFNRAVARELVAQSPAPGQPLQILDAFARVQRVIRGEVPEPAEQPLAAALPPGAQVSVVLASAREDESPNSPESYALRTEMGFGSAVLPAAEAHLGESCTDGRRPTTPRLQAWAHALGTWYQAWPCQNPELRSRLSCDGGPRCLARPPHRELDGSASCRVLAEIALSNSCPVALDWTEVSPAEIESERRVCEIPQLQGDELWRCRTTLTCDGCRPGWCWTEVPELTPREDCAPGKVYPAFRFVAGAGPRARLHIVCNTD